MKRPTFELPLKIDGKAITNEKKELYSVLRNEQDAEFIVEACNNYKKLVNQLKEFTNFREPSPVANLLKPVIDELERINNARKLLKELNEL